MLGTEGVPQLLDDIAEESLRFLTRTTLIQEPGDVGQYLESVRVVNSVLFAKLLEEEHARIYKRIFNMVDSRLNFREVRMLAEEVDLDSPTGELVLFKLARIFCHLRDYKQCSETVDRYLDIHPARPLRRERSWS